MSIRLLGLALLFVVGCQPAGPKLLPVEGKVTVDGKAIKGNVRSYVIFRPDTSKGNATPQEPNGQIDVEGNFKMTTGDKSGVPTGWYTVRIDAADPIDMANPYTTKWLVPLKYIDFESAKLTIEVVEKAEAGHYDFKLVK